MKPWETFHVNYRIRNQQLLKGLNGVPAIYGHVFSCAASPNTAIQWCIREYLPKVEHLTTGTEARMWAAPSAGLFST